MKWSNKKQISLSFNLFIHCLSFSLWLLLKRTTETKPGPFKMFKNPIPAPDHLWPFLLEQTQGNFPMLQCSAVLLD